MPILFLQNSPPATTPPPRHLQHNVSLYTSPLLPSLSNSPSITGDLYVTDSLLYFYSHQDDKGFSLDYASIGIHAIARLPDIYAPAPYVYCQLEQHLPEEDSSLLELRFVPEDNEAVDAIFQALCECAALHPDIDPDEDENDYDFQSRFNCYPGQEEGQFDDENEQEALDENGLNIFGRRTLERLESMLIQGEEATVEESADFEQR